MLKDGKAAGTSERHESHIMPAKNVKKEKDDAEIEKKVARILKNYLEEVKSAQNNIVETTSKMDEASADDMLKGDDDEYEAVSSEENESKVIEVADEDLDELDGAVSEELGSNVTEVAADDIDLSSPQSSSPEPCSTFATDMSKEEGDKNEAATSEELAGVLAAASLQEEELDEIEAAAASEELELNVTEVAADDIHESSPQSLSPEPCTNSKTNESYIQGSASSSTAFAEADATAKEPSSSQAAVEEIQESVSSSSTAVAIAAEEPSSSQILDEEQPNQSNRRLRTRASRYVSFDQGDNDMDEEEEEPVTKKRRKRNNNDTTVTYDCKIEGANKIFDVNKELLSQKSKAFADLFSVDPEKSFYELEGIPDRTLEAAFNFCHGKSLKDNMNNKEFYSLLFLAYTFEIPELKVHCEEKLVERISPLNVCDTANAGCSAKSDMLRSICKNYILENLYKTPLRNHSALNKELNEEILEADFKLRQ